MEVLKITTAVLSGAIAGAIFGYLVIWPAVQPHTYNEAFIACENAGGNVGQCEMKLGGK